MEAELIQILLNTLEPNTTVVKDSQIKLEQLERLSEFPVFLGEIICKSQNHLKKLDLIAVVALSKCLKKYYKGYESDVKFNVSEMMIKMLEIVTNQKVANEIILIFRYILILEYPEGAVFQTVVENFTEQKLENLTPYRKLVYLKLFYKAIKGIHREKIKTTEQLQQFKILLNDQTNQCLVVLMRQLVNSLSFFSNQLEALKSSPLSNLEINLSEVFMKLDQTFFLETAKYIFKIYSFNNLISKYSPLGDFNVVVLARHSHSIYRTISDILISSGLIDKIQSSKELEGVLKITHVTEKHLMESVEHRILKVEDTETIFEHFVSMYFSNNDQLVFFGEKFINYNQLTDPDYLRMVCETEIYSQLKFYEQKLLTNCMNTLSGILINFGEPLKEINFSDISNQTQEKGSLMKKFFIAKLDIILSNIFNQILLIDVNEFYKLKIDPEEYYASISHPGDEECDIREAAQALIKNICEYIDEEIIIKICDQIQNELLNFAPEKLEGFKQILKREANYYLLSKIYVIAKNHTNYDAILLQCANTDLTIQDKNYDIVKVQLLQLIQLYTQKSYVLEEEFSKGVFTIVYNLIVQQATSDICLILIALKILLHLIETNSSFVSLIPEVALPIFSLSKQVTNVDSKLTIFEFFEYSIVGNFPQYYSVVWEICEASYESCQDTSIDTLNLKSKIINIFIKLIEVSEIEYQKIPLIVKVLEGGIQDDENFEEFTMEASFHLFGKLLTKLDFKNITEEIAYRMTNLIQIVCSIFKRRFDYIPISVLILENCMISQIPAFLQIIGKNLLQSASLWMTDLKESAIEYFFDMVELYLMVADKENKLEFSQNLLEQGLVYIKTNEQGNPTYLKSVLRFLARLSYEDTEVLYYILNSVSDKIGISNFKYNLLSDFYNCIKEETIYNSYYVKKSFCFYTLAILTLYLKELEANEGINFNKMELNNTNTAQADLKAILEVFCRCLSELYAYDSNQLEYIEPLIYNNCVTLFSEDDYLKANEFNLDSYIALVHILLHDPMRKFDIYSNAKAMFGKSQLILNDPEYKSIIEKGINF